MSDAGPPLIYVAGPFTGPTAWDIAENVRAAERIGLEVARAGGMPVIPHANTHLFHGQLTSAFWYAGTLALMRVCAGVVFLPTWQKSTGSIDERVEADRLEIPTLFLPSAPSPWGYELAIAQIREFVRQRIVARLNA